MIIIFLVLLYILQSNIVMFFLLVEELDCSFLLSASDSFDYTQEFYNKIKNQVENDEIK